MVGLGSRRLRHARRRSRRLGRASGSHAPPAGAAEDSDVPAAAMLQARSFGSAVGSSRSSAQVQQAFLLAARGPSLPSLMAPAVAPLSTQRRGSSVPAVPKPL